MWWLVAVVLLAAVSLIDHRGWLLYSNEWRRFDGKQFTVVAIVDGDTIDVVASGASETHRVRLWGIDTPETAKPFLDEDAEPFADEAEALTRQLCTDKTVRLHLEQHRIRGKFGRLLAYVELPDGSILNESLLIAGLARFESRFPHSRFARYELLEQQAKYDKVGLWSPRK